MNGISTAFNHPVLLDQRHRLGKRLWLSGAGAALFIVTLLIGDAVLSPANPTHRLALGHDLIPAYTAGAFVRAGRIDKLYDRPALRDFEAQLVREANLEMDPRYGPWLNPPFFAWVFAPMAGLPYRQASALWLAINLLLLSVSAALLCRILLRPSPTIAVHPLPQQKIGWRNWGLVPLLLVLPMPFWQALGHQQNTFLSLAVLCTAVTLWRAGRGFAAGAVAGLLLFKPQLGTAVAGVMILSCGPAALAGFAMTAAALLGATLVGMPGAMSDYLHKLPPALHWLQNECPYNWGRQVTFQSFWRLLLQGHVRGETRTGPRVLWWMSSAVVALMLTGAAWKARVARQREPVNRAGRLTDRLIAATVVSMPLVMPYYMDYDLLLLAVPLTLLAAEWIRKPAITGSDWRLFWAWVALFAVLYFNPGVAGHSRLNLAPPLLSLIAAGQIARCFAAKQERVDTPGQHEHALAAAA